MTNGNTPHYAADEVVAPALIALKAWYDEVRDKRVIAPLTALPPDLSALPGIADLALVEVYDDGRFIYRAMGEGFRRTAGLKPGPDGLVAETRPVIRQHFDLSMRERRAFHVSVTRWDGPKILQYDRLILPLDDGQGSGENSGISHLLVGEVFLRVAKPG
jgi:hypothetical protein